jgi:hypothetical protein
MSTITTVIVVTAYTVYQYFDLVAPSIASPTINTDTISEATAFPSLVICNLADLAPLETCNCFIGTDSAIPCTFNSTFRFVAEPSHSEHRNCIAANIQVQKDWSGKDIFLVWELYVGSGASSMSTYLPGGMVTFIPRDENITNIVNNYKQGHYDRDIIIYRTSVSYSPELTPIKYVSKHWAPLPEIRENFLTSNIDQQADLKPNGVKHCGERSITLSEISAVAFVWHGGTVLRYTYTPGYWWIQLFSSAIGLFSIKKLINFSMRMVKKLKLKCRDSDLEVPLNSAHQDVVHNTLH